MLKHKDSEFFDEIFKEGVDEQKMQRYSKTNKKISIVFQGKEYHIPRIINFYKVNIHSNNGYISNNYYHEKYNIIEEKKIIEEILNNYQKVTNVIKSYPNFVLSAAQLK